MPVVYADVLVTLNWLVDYLLLSAVAVVLRIPVRRWRMVIAALVGGFSSCLIFLPPVPVPIRLVTDVTVAAVMVGIGFSFCGMAVFAKRTAVLFILSALFAGVVSALVQWTAGDILVVGNGQVYADISPIQLALFSVVSYASVRVYERVTRKHLSAEGEYHLHIEEDGGVYEGRALHDTGLHLREPFSGASVIVVEREPLTKALPAVPKERIRMIPYRSVGGDGLLTAFRPKRVRLERRGKERDVTGVYVAVTETLGRGEYEALIGSDLTE